MSGKNIKCTLPKSVSLQNFIEKLYSVTKNSVNSLKIKEAVGI